MSQFSHEALLLLYSIPNIGPVKMRSLISFFGSPEAVLSASARQLLAAPGFEKKSVENILTNRNETFVKEQMILLEKHSVQLLSYWDAEYPERLKSIYDPPVFLFVKGELNILKEPMIDIVGARKPSGYGKMVTETMSAQLVKNGYGIVSGFARGVDTAAHKTALKNNGKTIGVLGNGLDINYPAENKQLRDTLFKSGLFISEYPMGEKPEAGNFPKRNRIISGLSSGVLVTEAGEKSGALLTAFYALDQNRDVFAIPGTIVSENSVGTNRLIKEGAKLVQNVEDILVEVDSAYEQNTPPDRTKLPNLPQDELAIYQAISSEAKHVDQIAYQCKLSVSETLTLLLTLELKGLVRQMAGKMYIRL
jgi:DNA processing protein